MRHLMRPFLRTRFGAMAFALAVMSFVPAGCGEDASPTTPAPPVPPPPAPTPAAPPPVQARDVVDRETLKVFVERAAEVLSGHASDWDAAYAFLDANFRSEGEWRHGEIYVFVLTMEGINRFAAPNRDWEGTDFSQTVDRDGVHLFEGILAAALAGGGFTEYQWDNPAIEGDEEHGSPKLAYVVPVTVGGTPMILGSGIYPGAAAP